MKAYTHTPVEIFGNQIRYVVPLFQRPYVWTEEAQWKPLWDDVAALSERILDTPVGFGAPPVPPHFLGAIVVEQALGPVALIGVRNVIDGQQRLTTLQLLLDAAQWIVERHGSPADAQALKVLVENNQAMAQDPDHVFKVWPTDRDQAAFRAAMSNDMVVPPDLAGSRIAQGHAFFLEQISEWAEVTGDPDKARMRLSALGRAVRDHLKVVVIDLEPGDNAQVIFETLNHRGTPLLAADLVKNLVFQVALAQGHDALSLYRSHWRDLDSDYWRNQIAQGRLYRPRIDVFLNRWVVMKLLRDVPSDRIFSDFRDQIVLTQPEEITRVIAEVSSDAAVHASMEKLPAESVEGTFHYRVLKAMDTQVIGPVLLWLLRHSEEQMPQAQRHKALEAIESWLVRRAMIRATTRDYNKYVLELLKELVEAGPAVAGDTTVRVLSSSSTESRFWPNDERVRAALSEEPIYNSLTRPRLRMVLEAVEDASRSSMGEGLPCPKGLTIEHVMPRAWEEHWGADIAGDTDAKLRRNRLVHTLGNLTLVSGKLNPSMSNRPWTDGAARARGVGEIGKRSYLLQHSQLKLNSDLVFSHETSWTENDIRQRTEALSDRILALWPCPADAVQPVGAQPSGPPGADVPTEPSGKYQPLSRWLLEQQLDEVRLTFDEVEGILGEPLPASADHQRHWRSYGGSAVTRAIQDAGWRTSEVDPASRRVVLARLQGDDDLELQPWGMDDGDREAAQIVWDQLSSRARQLVNILLRSAPEPVASTTLADAIGAAGPLGVAGILTRPGALCTGMQKQWLVRWMEGRDGEPSQYYVDEATASVFRPLAQSTPSDGVV